jgi:hypothetical protein
MALRVADHLWRLVMTRTLAFVGFALTLVLSTTGLVAAAEFGTAEEAKAMLERAVAAVKEDKAKALDMFNKGEGGFRTVIFMCTALMPRTASSRRRLTGIGANI